MQGFQKVVGHQEIITHLQNAISVSYTHLTLPTTSRV